MLQILLGHDSFPITFRDVDIGAYFIECKIPEMDSMNRVQLMLDTNMVADVSRDPHVFMQKVGWYFGREAEVSVNPSIAIVEQYLSNSYDGARKNIERFESSLAEYKMFNAGYAGEMLRHSVANRDSLRQVVGVSFCYLAVLRSLYLSKDGSNALDKWIQFFANDIPRLQVLYIVGSLLLLSKEQRQLRFARGGKKIDDFAGEIFAFRKEERSDFSRWLRNRTFDLLYFMAAPLLSIKESAGMPSRTVVISKDRFVGEFIGRLITWGGEQKANEHWILIPQIQTIEQSDEKTRSSIEKILGGVSPARPPTEFQNKDRVRRLIEFALVNVDKGTAAGLHKSMSEYMVYDML